MSRKADFRILAFDPGETTGYCAVDGTGNVLAQGEFPMWEKVVALMDEISPNVVVIESFQLYPWKSKAQGFSTFPPVEVIGVIKFLCEHHDLLCVTQMPILKKFFTDTRLVKYHANHPSIHARDAARHALYYGVFTHKTIKALR